MNHFDKYVDLSAIFLLAVMIVVNLDVLIRFVWTSVPEFREIAVILTVWLIVLPIAQVTVDDRHIKIDFFYRRMSDRIRGRVDMLNAIVSGVVFASIVVSGALALESFMDQTTTFLGLSMAVVYFPLCYIAFVIMADVFDKQFDLRSRLSSMLSS